MEGVRVKRIILTGVFAFPLPFPLLPPAADEDDDDDAAPDFLPKEEFAGDIMLFPVPGSLQ